MSYFCSMFGRKERKTNGALIVLLVMALLSACANMGTPDGGAFDETPPVLLGTSPKINSLNYTDKKVELHFNEFVKLLNISEKVIISPPQITPPKITTQPTKKISITFQEELKPNTTYSIDFSDAIVDNNEGNPFGNYAFTFSTGDVVDTLQISGHILEAENLNPVKGIFVGVHPLQEGDTIGQDSAFFKNPLTRISRTDEQGFFTVKGLAPGNYQVVALQDGDQNFVFNQKSERIAFLSKAVTPTTTSATRRDTVWADSVSFDSVRLVTYTRYLPDDILLRVFKEDASILYFQKAERLIPQSFQIYFSGASPQVPRLKGLNFNENDLILERSLHNDSLRYWLKDTLMAKIDTLKMAIEYLQTDTAGLLSMTSDTLLLPVKAARRSQSSPPPKRKKKDEVEEVPEIQFLPLRATPAGGTMELTDNIHILFEEPILRIDSAAFYLQEKEIKDTIWKPKPFLVRQDSLKIRDYTILSEWDPDKEYMLRIDSASVHGIYGTFNNKVEQKIRVRSLDDYASLFLTIKDIHTPAYVELLTNNEKVVRRDTVDNGKVEFYFLRPGKYYARLIMDNNRNGKWDTGLYPTRQPESVYYCPEAFELQILGEEEYAWDIYELTLDRQKPQDLRPKVTEKRTQTRNRNATRRR